MCDIDLGIVYVASKSNKVSILFYNLDFNLRNIDCMLSK